MVLTRLDMIGYDRIRDAMIPIWDLKQALERTVFSLFPACVFQVFVFFSRIVEG